MSSVIPKKMRALFLTKLVKGYDAADLEDHFEVKEIDVPVPGPGEVLVRIECSPINPSDLSTLQGSYNSAQREELPSRTGYEGSGTVVQSGGGLMGWMVSGKRVAIAAGKPGVWAEYVVVNALQCLPLPDDVSFEEGSSCFVNPLTVIAFLEITKSKGSKAVLLTAAASAVGKMLVRLAREEGIEVVCVVRREEQAKILQDIGAKHIINSSEEDWKAKLKAKCQELNVIIGFDSIAGPTTGEILHEMPRGSEIQVFGGLSNQNCSSISPTDLIFSGKKVTGFWLTAYLNEKSLIGKKAMLNKVTKYVKTALATDIRVTYPIEKAADAIRDYNKNMSLGKVAFKPSELPK
eukprot:c21884_g2_i1.p1 GENE.c21884_g2_i1~~c21884_g2_i1.p1  ORF type:complete len:349 (-),score=166.68 c21884_g2_i1:142-1188(-)